jgi:NAD(P)H-flavin reductase
VDSSGCHDVYKPLKAVIEEVREEAKGARGIKTYKVSFLDPKDKEKFQFKSGQCAMLSMLGVGESMISITSPPIWKDFLEFSIMRVGNVTSAIHQLEPGDVIGIRGPYGNCFPVEEFKGKDCLFIGGGIGIAPVRSMYQYVLGEENRSDFGDVTIMYGARTPEDLAYMKEFEELEKRDDVSIWLCIDWKFGKDGIIDEDAREGWPKINLKEPGKTEIKEGQNRFTCFVPQLVEVVKPKPENTVALTCGPPIAIKYVMQNLAKLGFRDEQIFTTLENRMKCGVGKCGRCNIGEVYVCKDGPVFTKAEINRLFPEF